MRIWYCPVGALFEDSFNAQAVASSRFGDHLDGFFALTSKVAVKKGDDLSVHSLQLDDNINTALFDNYPCVLTLCQQDLISVLLPTIHLALDRPARFERRNLRRALSPRALLSQC